jgi:serine/threonine protein kinase
MKPEPHPQSDDDDPSDESPKDQGQGDSNPPEPDADDQAPSSSAFFDLEEGDNIADQNTLKVPSPPPEDLGKESPPRRELSPDEAPILRIRNKEHPQPDLPCHLGEVVLESYLAEGGMASVYRGRIKSSGRSVAVKLAYAASHHAHHLRNEIEKLSAINSVHVVHLVAHGEHDGLLWAAVDLVEGTPLLRLVNLRRQGIPISDAFHDSDPETPRRRSNGQRGSPDRIDASTLHRYVRCFAQAARAIDDIAHAGFTHRDLSPNNVMIARGGIPVLIDFGLSIDEDDDTSGAFVGTPGYQSPEHATGGYGKLDQRSDLYSIAIAFYELIAGRTAGKPPSRSNRAELVHEILHRHIPPISRDTKGVPASLDPIFAHALENDIERRYQSGTQLAEDLELWLDGEALRHARETIKSKVRRRRPLLLSTLAGMVLLVLGGYLAWNFHDLSRIDKLVAEINHVDIDSLSWTELTDVARRSEAAEAEYPSHAGARQLTRRHQNEVRRRTAILTSIRKDFDEQKQSAPEILDRIEFDYDLLRGHPELEAVHESLVGRAANDWLNEVLREAVLPLAILRIKRNVARIESVRFHRRHVRELPQLEFIICLDHVLQDAPEAVAQHLETCAPATRRRPLLLLVSLLAKFECEKLLEDRLARREQDARGVALGFSPSTDDGPTREDITAEIEDLRAELAEIREEKIRLQKTIESTPLGSSRIPEVCFKAHMLIAVATRDGIRRDFASKDKTRLKECLAELNGIGKADTENQMILSARSRLAYQLGDTQRSIRDLRTLLKEVSDERLKSVTSIQLAAALLMHGEGDREEGQSEITGELRFGLKKLPVGLGLFARAIHRCALTQAEGDQRIVHGFNALNRLRETSPELVLNDDSVTFLRSALHELSDKRRNQTLIELAPTVENIGLLQGPPGTRAGAAAQEIHSFIAWACFHRVKEAGGDLSAAEKTSVVRLGLHHYRRFSEQMAMAYESRCIRLLLESELPTQSTIASESFRSELADVTSVELLEKRIERVSKWIEWQVRPENLEREKRRLRESYTLAHDYCVQVAQGIELRRREEATEDDSPASRPPSTNSKPLDSEIR